MSDSGRFPIAEAQIVGLFMECVAYGACFFRFAGVRWLTNDDSWRYLSCYLWAVYQGTAMQERPPGAEGVGGCELGDVLGGYSHVYLRYV